MAKRFLMMCLALGVALAMQAVPAKPVKKTITVDGQAVEVTLTGDELMHCWSAADGRSFVLDADGVYVPVDAKAERARRVQALRRAPIRRLKPATVPIVGKKKGLVILAETSDVRFSCSDNPNATFTALMNEEGFSQGTATGSVRDYFRDQSFGKLDYEFDVVGPVMVSREMAYYGGNGQYDYESVTVAEMVMEAVLLADKQVDFADYDVDGDGEVENVYMIFAGYSEAQGGYEDRIWPHAWQIGYANYWNPAVKAPVCDGVKVDAYACSSEFRGTSGKQVDAIGTICHEFSHCLGLPDSYNVNNPHNDYTNGYWDVMDAGMYTNNADTPMSYSAYERWACGWIEPVELTEDTVVRGMESLDDSGLAYVYYNEACPTEFYILHNIQRKGWCEYAYASGLAIYHVDYDEYAWYMDAVNNDPEHLRMQMFCADNKYSFDNMPGDLYPGTSGNNRLTSTSKPAAKVFNVNADGRYMMGKNLTNIIKNSQGLISFRFVVEGSLKEAVGISAPDASSQSVELYNLQGQRVGDGYRGIVVGRDGRKILQ